MNKLDFLSGKNWIFGLANHDESWLWIFRTCHVVLRFWMQKVLVFKIISAFLWWILSTDDHSVLNRSKLYPNIENKPHKKYKNPHLIKIQNQSQKFSSLPTTSWTAVKFTAVAASTSCIGNDIQIYSELITKIIKKIMPFYYISGSSHFLVFNSRLKFLFSSFNTSEFSVAFFE